MRKKRNSEILCYADDNLIIATGKDLKRTWLRASVFTTRVINFIKILGLDVAMNKTEAILFHPKGANNLPTSVKVEDILVIFSLV